jgi:hypothetical protein
VPLPAYYANYPPVQWPMPAVPPPQRRVGLGVFIAVTVVVALVSCGVGVVGGLVIRPARATVATPAAASQSPTSSPSSSPSSAPDDGAALWAKILPLPAGATDIGVSGSTNGVMTLDQFIQKAFHGDPTELARMKAREFNVAAQRNWVGSDGIEVHIQLVAFAAATGAESFLFGQINAYSKDSEVTGTFSLPVSQGTGFEKSALDSAGNRGMILLTQAGPVAVLIFLFTPAALDRASGIDLMKRQYVAIAAHS